MRTSKLGVFVRSSFVIFCIFLPMSWVWNSITQTYFFTVTDMAISAVVTVAFYGGFAWLVTNLGMNLMYGSNPQYQAYKRNGGDPYIDILPSILKPNSSAARQTGREEPPASWKFCCPSCNARVQHQIDVCWNCNYGADSDSSVYFEQNGSAKPPEISEGEWEEIKRRNGV